MFCSLHSLPLPFLPSFLPSSLPFFPLSFHSQSGLHSAIAETQNKETENPSKFCLFQMHLASPRGFGLPLLEDRWSEWCWTWNLRRPWVWGHLETWMLWCLGSMPRGSPSAHSSRTSVMIRFLIATVTFLYIFADDLLISIPPVSICRRPCIVEFLPQSREKWREQMRLWLIFQCWIYKKIFCQTLHSSLWGEINPMNKIVNRTWNRCFI